MNADKRESNLQKIAEFTKTELKHKVHKVVSDVAADFICVNLQLARHSPAAAGRRLVHLRFVFASLGSFLTGIVPRLRGGCRIHEA